MNFANIAWADSNIEKIEIEYGCAKIYVYNYTLKNTLCISCKGFIGLTNLCIWDDQIIAEAAVYQVNDDKDPFIQAVFTAYDKDYNYGERRLNNGIIELRIKPVNDISFSVYCQKIDVNYN